MGQSKIKIRFENLIKIYGDDCSIALKLFRQGADRATILKATGQVLGIADVSFTISQGEFLVLMGLSGSGKSTLLRCINRLITPSSGHLYIDDEDIVNAEEKRIRQIRLTQVSMVFQNFGLFPHRTVAANVEYGLKLQGMGKAHRHRKAQETLESVGLSDWVNHKPESLSGGMKQRVGLARALATDAEILLMDEPFSALDPLTRREMQDELLRLQKTLHRTIVFVSHDINEALRLGDRIAVIKQGELVQLGTPEELLYRPANDYIRGFTRDVNRAQVLRAGMIVRPAISLTPSRGLEPAVLTALQSQNPKRVCVLNPEGKPYGFIAQEHFDRLLHLRVEQITSFVQTQLDLVDANTPLEDILHRYHKDRVLAVVDATGLFQGVIELKDVLTSIGQFDEVPAINS